MSTSTDYHLKMTTGMTTLLCFVEVDPKVVPQISNLYQRTEESLNQEVATLRKWMETQPHLPEMMNDKSMENIFLLCKCSIEKAKQRIDMYYTIRDILPDIYENINPRSSEVKENLEIAYYLPLPKMTPELYRVTLLKVRTDSMIGKLEPRHLQKVLLNTLEIRLHEDVMLGDIFLIDMKGIDLSFFTKITPSHLHKFFVIYEKIFSLPLKGIVYVNSPPYIDTLITLVKRFLKPKLFDRIHVCLDESILFQRFPKEMIPKDYGGEEKSLEELQEIQKQKFAQYQERFDHLDTLKVDESSRPGKLEIEEVLEFDGNFKRIYVD